MHSVIPLKVLIFHKLAKKKKTVVNILERLYEEKHR